MMALCLEKIDAKNFDKFKAALLKKKIESLTVAAEAEKLINKHYVIAEPSKPPPPDKAISQAAPQSKSGGYIRRKPDEDCIK